MSVGRASTIYRLFLFILKGSSHVLAVHPFVDAVITLFAVEKEWD